MQLRRQYLISVLLANFFLFTAIGIAQAPESSDVELKKRIESSPVLPLEKTPFQVHPAKLSTSIGPVSGVATDGKGTVYVMQRGEKVDPILAFDVHGTLLRSWGKGDFTLPHSLRVDPEGNIWAVDAGVSRIIKYSPLGKKLLTVEVGQTPNTGSAFRGATDIAFLPNGHLLVTDGYGNARVLEFTADGLRLREWGHSGSGPGEFHLPHSLQVSKNGTVFVADRENGRIEEFDLQGRFLKAIDHLGRCYSLKLMDGALWASMSPLGQDPGAPGWIVKIDPTNGTILGHLNVTEQREGHQLDVLPSRQIFVTAGNGLLFFR